MKPAPLHPGMENTLPGIACRDSLETERTTVPRSTRAQAVAAAKTPQHNLIHRDARLPGQNAGDRPSRKIPLTQGLFALVDEADYPEISKHKWCAMRRPAGNYYAVRGVFLPNGSERTEYMHRAILGVRPGFETDHRNGNGLDNRRCNLRFATHAQNLSNRRQRSLTGFKGVSHWPSKAAFKRYLVNIRHNGKTRHIGLFDDPVEAARAYDAKAKELQGEFACLNFPTERP